MIGGAWLCGRADETPPDAPAAKPSVSAATWGTLDPMTRLLPIDSYDGPTGRALSLAGARGEVVDQQIVLLAGDRPWRGVSLTFSPLSGPKGTVIAGSALRWRRVGSVRTRRPKYETRYVGLWPDPLLPAASFDIAPHGRAVAWIDLAIPPDTAAGKYAGTVTLAAQGASPLRVPFTLRVWGFTLPRRPHIKTAFGIMSHGDFPIDYQALGEDMLAHRISPINGIGEPRLVTPPTPGHPGQWDWSEFDRAAESQFAKGLSCFMVTLHEPRDAWAREWQNHLEARGWLPRAYTYLADEPEAGQLAAVNAQLAVVKQAAPRLPNLITAKGFPPALTNVDIWCPEIIHFDPAGARREQARGKAVWWYPAYSTPHPRINLWTDYPALDCRVWPWMTWKYDLDGMLYWNITNWQPVPDPLQEASFFQGGEGAANGDGELLYPGPGGKPLDSIRWECLRDGLQDYEVFCLLEAGAQALQAAHKSPDLVRQAQALLAIDPNVVASFTQYNPDPDALLAARERMSQTVEKMVAALGHEPAILDRPRPRPSIANGPR